MKLSRDLRHWRRFSDGRQIVKLSAWLTVYYSGLFSLVRRMRGGKSRGAILLYHRVNDMSEDVLTTSTRRFAEHLVTLNKYYTVKATEELVEQIGSHKSLERGAVAIHFDDCYRDVLTCACPLLAAANSPATAFVSSGFVNTDRAFRHDQEKYPFRFENFTTRDLCELQRFGVSIGAHTVNHIDLGTATFEQARIEVVESGRQLEGMISRPVPLFSFPFGGIDNIREEIRRMVAASGYTALFSAHGGFIDDDTTAFDIPRLGVSSDHSPLALMMELDGFSVSHWKNRIRSKFRSAA